MNGRRATTESLGHGRCRGSVVRALLAAACLATIWGGCNAQKNYKLLSFFFDGVPDPNARRGLMGDASTSPTFSNHAPFAAEECLQCHEDPSQMRMNIEDSGLCLKCHDDVMTQFPRMHGAVVAPACLRCHNPHFSALANLLRESAPALCLQCHDTNMLGGTPAHLDLTRDCLECHTGHGGSEAHFLRKTWKLNPPTTPTPAPTATPTTESAAGSSPDDAS